MTPGPTITSQATEAEVDRNNLKITILGILGIGASILAARIFMALLADLRTDYFVVWGVSVCVFITLLMLQTIFIKSRTKLQMLMFLQGIAPAVLLFEYFYPAVSFPLFIGIFLSCFFYMIAANRGWTILANSLNIKFSFIAKNTIPKALTGVLIFSSLFAYTYYFEAGKFTKDLGQSVVYQLLDASQPLVEMWFPGVSFSQSGKEFFERIATTQLEKIPFEEAAKNPALAEFGKLPEKEKQKIIVEAGAKVRIAAESSFGAFPANEPVKNSVFIIVQSWTKDMKQKFGDVFSIVLTIIIFFSLKGFFALFHWLAALVAFLTYKFLIVTGFAYTNIESRSREFILLS